MSKNPLFCKENEKVIRNRHADPDHHQKLITSRKSPLAHVCQVWSTSVSALVSYSVYKMTERMTERSHNLHLVGEGNNIHNSIPYKVVNLQAVVARVRSCRNACLQAKPARFEPRFDKKLSCRRETAWCIVLLNSSLSHSRSVNVIGNDTLE